MTEKKKTTKIISMAERKAKASKMQLYILCPDGALIDSGGYIAELKLCVHVELDPKDVFYDVEEL